MRRKRRAVDPIHENIAKYRVKLGISQSALARLLKIDETAVSHWECGVSAPNRSRIGKVAEVLGVSIGDLYGDR